MKNILFCLAIMSCSCLQAQHYYNDIVSIQEIGRQMKTYLDNKVRSVTAAGYDNRGAKTNDFDEWQEVRDNGHGLKITTRNGQSVTRLYYQFDDKNRLINVIDSSTDVQSNTTYGYDTEGRIIEVRNVMSIRDSSSDFNETEVHTWRYDAAGKPVSMWRTINGSDSMEVRYTMDENGNPGDERMYKRGVETGTIYYYYDDRNRLTDIVRYNNRARRLLPDFMFEYDEKDRVIQKITTTSNLSLGYLIWRYLFNDQGLKTKEALFNKDKELTGRIEYSYTFGY